MPTRPRIVLASLVLTLASFSPRVLACPNCKEAVAANQGEAQGMADGYNWSILFMLGVPASLLGAGGVAIRRAVKQGTFPEL